MRDIIGTIIEIGHVVLRYIVLNYFINLNYINHINDHISASFSIVNLLDTHYKTFGSGISASGRNFVVSLTSKF